MRSTDDEEKQADLGESTDKVLAVDIDAFWE